MSTQDMGSIWQAHQRYSGRRVGHRLSSEEWALELGRGTLLPGWMEMFIHRVTDQRKKVGRAYETGKEASSELVADGRPDACRCIKRV